MLVSMNIVLKTLSAVAEFLYRPDVHKRRVVPNRELDRNIYLGVGSLPDGLLDLANLQKNLFFYTTKEPKVEEGAERMGGGGCWCQRQYCFSFA